MTHHAQLPRQVKGKHKLSSALLRRTLSVVCSSTTNRQPP